MYPVLVSCQRIVFCLFSWLLSYDPRLCNQQQILVAKLTAVMVMFHDFFEIGSSDAVVHLLLPMSGVQFTVKFSSWINSICNTSSSPFLYASILWYCRLLYLDVHIQSALLTSGWEGCCHQKPIGWMQTLVYFALLRHKIFVTLFLFARLRVYLLANGANFFDVGIVSYPLGLLRHSYCWTRHLFWRPLSDQVGVAKKQS